MLLIRRKLDEQLIAPGGRFVRLWRWARCVYSPQSLSFTAGSESRKEGERAGACLTAGVLEFNKHLRHRIGIQQALAAPQSLAEDTTCCPACGQCGKEGVVAWGEV